MFSWTNSSLMRSSRFLKYWSSLWLPIFGSSILSLSNVQECFCNTQTGSTQDVNCSCCLLLLRFCLRFCYPDERTTVWIQPYYWVSLNDEGSGVYFCAANLRMDWLWNGHNPSVFTHFVVVVSFANKHWTSTVFWAHFSSFSGGELRTKLWCPLDTCIVWSITFAEEWVNCTHSDLW